MGIGRQSYLSGWLTRRVCATGLACATALAVGAGFTASALGAEAAVSRSQAASEDGVSAVLSYKEGIGGPLPYFNLSFAISRSGASVYDQPVSSRYCSSGCVPEELSVEPGKPSSVTVADLKGNGQPNVVLELNTSGAHCCTIVQVFSYDPGVMAYRSVERDFGDPGALITDVAGDGKLELESADDRFAYAFSSYAYSALPLEVWRFEQGRFVDATKEFPAAVAVNAAGWLKVFRANRRHGHGLGAIAAWAADEELLGHGALVTHTLSREARLHNLRSAEGQSPNGHAFVVRLERFLKKTGYT
ncbi:MAG TPA: hypothetical protein VIH71_11765 [Solirubrobacteraceae bacterium]